MNEGDCLKLHGKIDADDNARHTVPVIVFLFLHLPHTYRHLHQPGHCEGRHPNNLRGGLGFTDSLLLYFEAASIFLACSRLCLM